MDRKKVSSRILASYGYDPTTEIFEVELLAKKEGGVRKVYQYKIPAEIFRLFEEAQSQGGFYLTYIVRKFKSTEIKEKNENQTQDPLPPAA